MAIAAIYAYHIPMRVSALYALLPKLARAIGYFVTFFFFAALVNYWQAPSIKGVPPMTTIDVMTLDGEKKQLRLISDKKTVLYFFAPWCIVCKASMDALNFFSNNSSVQALAVGLDYDTIEELKQFQTRLSVPVYAGSRLLQQHLRVDRYPTAYILNSDGSIAHVMVGYISRLGIWIRTIW